MTNFKPQTSTKPDRQKKEKKNRQGRNKNQYSRNHDMLIGKDRVDELPNHVVFLVWGKQRCGIHDCFLLPTCNPSTNVQTHTYSDWRVAEEITAAVSIVDKRCHYLFLCLFTGLICSCIIERCQQMLTLCSTSLTDKHVSR